MSNVRQIVISHLQQIGADGLCCDGCRCGMYDLMPCGGDVDITACVPAKIHSCDHDYCDCDGACYRPIDTPNEPLTTKESA